MKKVLLAIAALTLIYLVGPHPSFNDPQTPLLTVPQDADGLEQYILNEESKHTLKPDNEARIIWYDSLKRKTPYSIVYLQGFSASQKEGDPIHRMVAETFGCNLFLNRLPEHGIDTTDALINLTSEKMWATFKESLAIGKAIGDRVILMSTSTGGTGALYLASKFPEDVAALINLSPNIEIKNPSAFILNNPWGLQIARLKLGSDYIELGGDSITSVYWTRKYRLEALSNLQEFIEKTMTKETFKNINAPSLTLYYYKNEQEQDPQVRVDAMLRMHSQLGTPDSLKAAIAIPNSGAHVIGSSLTSKDIEGVYYQIELFMTGKLGLKKVN